MGKITKKISRLTDKKTGEDFYLTSLQEMEDMMRVIQSNLRKMQIAFDEFRLAFPELQEYIEEQEQENKKIREFLCQHKLF